MTRVKRCGGLVETWMSGWRNGQVRGSLISSSMGASVRRNESYHILEIGIRAERDAESMVWGQLR